MSLDYGYGGPFLSISGPVRVGGTTEVVSFNVGYMGLNNGYQERTSLLLV